SSKDIRREKGTKRQERMSVTLPLHGGSRVLCQHRPIDGRRRRTLEETMVRIEQRQRAASPRFARLQNRAMVKRTRGRSDEGTFWAANSGTVPPLDQ
ncbi:hypothetical protein BaRGS_00003777, partial [Batillaria attramentaria]